MTQIASEDYPNLRIHLHVDTVSQGVDMVELYREHRALRAANANGERNFAPMVDAEGNDPIGGGVFTPNRAFVRTFVRVVPFDASHGLLINSQVISKGEGLRDRLLIDRLPLSPSVEVDIDSVYQDVEIREISTSGGTFTPADRATLNAKPSLIEIQGGVPDLAGIANVAGLEADERTQLLALPLIAEIVAAVPNIASIDAVAGLEGDERAKLLALPLITEIAAALPSIASIAAVAGLEPDERAAILALPDTDAIRVAVWAHVIKTGALGDYTASRLLDVAAAGAGAKFNRNGFSIAMRDVADTEDIVTGTVDGNGNRDVAVQP